MLDRLSLLYKKIPSKSTPQLSQPKILTCDLKKAEELISENFQDLVTILESFHKIYLYETKKISPLCEHYQREAIILAKSITQNHQIKNSHAWTFLFQDHDFRRFFDLLKTLREYQLELPDGWYPSIKFVLNRIRDASYTCRELQKTKSWKHSLMH